MNLPFLLSPVAFAARLCMSAKAARDAAHIKAFDAFHALIQQLPENSALVGLLLVQRYQPHNITKG
jgi:hypothetical protein